MTVLSPAPAVFLAIFLLFSPMSDLTFASASAETADVSSRVPVVMVVFDEVSTIAFEDARARIDQVLCPTWRRWRGTAPGSDTRRRRPI